MWFLKKPTEIGISAVFIFVVLYIFLQICIHNFYVQVQIFNFWGNNYETYAVSSYLLLESSRVKEKKKKPLHSMFYNHEHQTATSFLVVDALDMAGIPVLVMSWVANVQL